VKYGLLLPGKIAAAANMPYSVHRISSKCNCAVKNVVASEMPIATADRDRWTGSFGTIIDRKADRCRPLSAFDRKSKTRNFDMPDQVLRAPISVMIVEDDAVTRRILCMAVESEPAFRLVAQFDRVAPALEWLEANNKLDILLTDLGLPDGSGIDIIRACVGRCPSCNIMVITMSADEDNILTSLEAGASGYVLKDAGRTDIVSALLDMYAGGSPISPLIARKVLARIRSGKSSGADQEKGDSSGIMLTKREAAILDLIARGDSYGEVARALSVSVGTVQTHVKNIYGKLSVHSRGEAVFEAQRRGLLRMSALKSKK
jgi:DNA-binding NarL/FixJ family response regulator